MVRSMILALVCVSCCMLNTSFGQVTRAAWTPLPLQQIAQAYSLQRKVGGTYIQLDFKSSVDAYALVTLRKVQGSLPPGTDSIQISSIGKQHQVQFVNLEADTQYEVQIDLIPPAQFDGVLAPPLVFTFTTLQRHVFVALHDIWVFDDAEWAGAGSLCFNIQIGDEHANFNHPGNSWDYVNFHAHINSGTGINLPQSGKPNYLYQNNIHSTTLKIAVSANEWDYASSGIAFRPEEDSYLGTGPAGSYNDWNSGFKLIEIGHTFLTPEADQLYQQEALVRNFEIHVPASQHSDLSYTLSGQLVVAYW